MRVKNFWEIIEKYIEMKTKSIGNLIEFGWDSWIKWNWWYLKPKSNSDPNSTIISRTTKDQKFWAVWIRLQMTWNFWSVISKHIKKKYQKTMANSSLKKYFFGLCIPHIEGRKYMGKPKISKISDSLGRKSHQNMNNRWFQKIVHSRISI